MDMLSVGRDRFARVIRIIAIAVIVVLIIALIANTLNHRTILMRTNMIDSELPTTIMTSQGNGMMEGKAVAAPGIGMPYPEAKNVPTGGMMVNDSAPVQDSGVAVVDQKVIKTGNLALKVESTEKTMENVRWVSGQFGGDIFASSLYDTIGNGIGKSGVVTLRVPAAHFDEAMQSIKSAARVVVSETTSGQDVTSDYVDLQARLKNKQAEEASIAAILTRDTNKIDDVLQVTIQLARVRGEIEQLQAQVKYLDNQADMSIIIVSFTEDAQIGKTDTVWRPMQEIKDAFNALLKAGQRVVSFLISFMIVIVPILGILLLIFGSLLYVIVKKLYRWLKQ